MKSIFSLLLIILLFPGSKPKQASYKLTEAFPKLRFDQPVELISPGDGTDRLFVIAQKGIIHVFPNKTDAFESKEFLNITKKVESGGEKGLLGLAFHPDYKNNGYFYVNYTRRGPLETVIARFTVSKDDPGKADAGSEVVLLTYKQPFSNHNGGKIAFGKDGYLYISAGDGGSGGDPKNNGQDRTSLLGKIMRIDVDNRTGKLNYSIPQDNPYKGNKEGFREEIYAYGLRNVWKFSFDSKTGRLWAGDVGQNSREEVSIIDKGGNYGWKMMEGMVCYTGRNIENNENCNKATYIKPVHEYMHADGLGQSVTGGYVYRGKKMPELVGQYIYGDYTSGKIWALKQNADGTVSNELLGDMDGQISSFGEDKDKELYICSYGDGRIFQLTAAK